MTGVTLQQIGEEFADLDRLLEESGGELTPAIEERLAQVSLAEREKVDAYIGYVKSLEADAQAAKSLADELLAKAKTKMARAEFLKGRVEGYMILQGRDELAGTIWKFAFQKNGGKAPVVLGSENPDDFPDLCVRTVRSIDREAVRTLLEAGAVLPATIGERGRSLRIR
jgi:hypothetical protein